MGQKDSTQTTVEQVANVDRHAAIDVIDYGYSNDEIIHIDDDYIVVRVDDVPEWADDVDYQSVEDDMRQRIDYDLSASYVDVISTDHIDLLDEAWATTDYDIAIDKIDQQVAPDWVHRAIDLVDNADLTWRQATIVALMESDRYPEQRQIAELLDISPQAVSDSKSTIKGKIENVEYLKESSDLF